MHIASSRGIIDVFGVIESVTQYSTPGSNIRILITRYTDYEGVSRFTWENIQLYENCTETIIHTPMDVHTGIEREQ